MNKIVVPTLSEDGWVKTTEERADYLFAHFFVSEYSQTALYERAVASFPYIIQKNQGSITNTISELRQVLQSYFSRHFTNVKADAVANEDPPKSGKFRINLHVSFTDEDGKEFALAKVANVLNSKLVNVLNINNGVEV